MLCAMMECELMVGFLPRRLAVVVTWRDTKKDANRESLEGRKKKNVLARGSFLRRH
jgi:hypothetical protein